MTESQRRIITYLRKIAKEDVIAPKPITRYEQYLYRLATGGGKIPQPVTRIEMFLYGIIKGRATPKPVTVKEKLLKSLQTLEAYQGTVSGAEDKLWKKISDMKLSSTMFVVDSKNNGFLYGDYTDNDGTIVVNSSFTDDNGALWIGANI